MYSLGKRCQQLAALESVYERLYNHSTQQSYALREVKTFLSGKG